MRKVLRSMPRTCLPYMFFILMTPNRRAGGLVGVDEQFEGQPQLGLEALVRLQAVARDAEDFAAGFAELGVEVAELAGLGGAAGRVVLGVEIEHQRLAALGGELKVVPPVAGREKSGTAWSSMAFRSWSCGCLQDARNSSPCSISVPERPGNSPRITSWRGSRARSSAWHRSRRSTTSS